MRPNIYRSSKCELEAQEECGVLIVTEAEDRDRKSCRYAIRGQYDSPCSLIELSGGISAPVFDPRAG
jgi:hypothetical protein